MTALVTVCAWCQAELPDDERDKRPGISHGMCSAHLEKIKAEIEAKRREGAP